MKDLLDDHITNTSNKKFSELNAIEQFISILKRCGKNITDDLFGSINNPSSLRFDDVSDSIVCGECGKINNIFPKDVPSILRIAENFGNGIGASLRPLHDKFGVQYSKAKEYKGVLFTGIKSKITTYIYVPAKIKNHFDKIITKRQCLCAECSVVLIGRSFIDTNWEPDHKYSSDMHKYSNKKFREDPDNYQLLCKSCNAKKREIDRMKRNNNE